MIHNTPTIQQPFKSMTDPIIRDNQTADVHDDPESWLLNNKKLRMDANKAFFDEERRRFHIERYEFAKPYCQDLTVLDGACGTGYGTSILATTAKHATGIDLSDDAVTYAQQEYGSDNTQFQQSFVEATPFENNSFDAVVSFETVEHTLCPQSHMMEIARLLKPDTGFAILSIPNSWGYTKHHFFDFDIELLQEVTQPFFHEATFFYQNSASHSHRNHGGPIGIGPLEQSNAEQAECILAICKKPIKDNISTERYNFIMQEIYENAFARHRELLILERKERRRIFNQLKTLPNKLFR